MSKYWLYFYRLGIHLVCLFLLVFFLILLKEWWLGLIVFLFILVKTQQSLKRSCETWPFKDCWLFGLMVGSLVWWWRRFVTGTFDLEAPKEALLWIKLTESCWAVTGLNQNKSYLCRPNIFHSPSVHLPNFCVLFLCWPHFYIPVWGLTTVSTMERVRTAFNNMVGWMFFCIFYVFR